jgi:hypothetical protein
MVLSEAKTCHAYARECLRLAEQAGEPDIRQKLIELSRAWMEIALTKEGYHLDEIASKSPKEPTPSI